MHVVKPDILIYKINFIRERRSSKERLSIHNRNFALLLLYIRKVKICLWLTLFTVFEWNL